jgi:hypothetical protein
VLGAAKKRERTQAPSDAAELGEIRVRDLRGREVRLGDVWSQNPAVVVFLRHYG